MAVKRNDALAAIRTLRGLAERGAISTEEVQEEVRKMVATGEVRPLTVKAFEKATDLVPFAQTYGLIKVKSMRAASGTTERGTSVYVEALMPAEFNTLREALKPFAEPITITLEGGVQKRVLFQPYWRDVTTNGSATTAAPAEAGSAEV